ncbi:MAG: DUF4369 domain-containing protein [Prevotella sp.]|nr:DUF4369 domain-containing protein [Prevotella sp.]
MKTIIKTLISGAAMAVTVLFVASCDNSSKFTITGEITQAKDSMLYLDHMALEGVQIIDSIKLDEAGHFDFSVNAPTGAPDFYRLRIYDQIINLAVDSTETITVKADYKNMAEGYNIEGNDNCQKIKELTIKQMDLQARAQQVANDPLLVGTAPADSIFRMLNTYKAEVCRDYIYKDPLKASSYFALFQSIVVNNAYIMVFDPQRHLDDVKPFQAVATSWKQFYPESPRAQNLETIAMEGLKTKKIVEQQNKGLEIDSSKVTEVTLVDVPLADATGHIRHLTELKGKVVLLDFHLFSADDSPARILLLREIYNKYHDRGFEIYQVSLDQDDHFWKTQTDALPWINVRDTEGKQSLFYLNSSESVPCSFIISRDNEVVMAPGQIKNLEADIAKFL